MSRIFVGNIPHTNSVGALTSDNDLKEFIEEKGFEVLSVEVIRDRATGHSRGFGFAEIKGDTTDAIRALNNQRFGGRRLTVNSATPKSKAVDPNFTPRRREEW